MLTLVVGFRVNYNTHWLKGEAKKLGTQQCNKK